MANAYYEIWTARLEGEKRQARQGGGNGKEMMSAVGQQLTECSIDVVGMIRSP